MPLVQNGNFTGIEYADDFSLNFEYMENITMTS